MTVQGGDTGEERSERSTGRSTISDRIAAFMMLDAMGPATQAQRAVRLSLVGFTNAEIAEMLQTTTPTVAQSLYLDRKRLKAKDRPTGKPGRRSSPTSE